ncbi:MAG: DUF6600 domain-containing protein [Candidatus Sulfomarinibacteraceae bacterium]
MTRKSTTLLSIAAALVLTAGASPADAGGYVGIGVSNHGLSIGFGASNWSIWGSSWDSGHASFGFSASLSGYGEWVEVGGLGTVWRPWVAAGWQPYSHGRWVWTSLGWTWVAYEPWGWIPHHYGNWAYTTVGWVWTPGYTYHPGNVVWVSSGAYLGWYPCAPKGWSHGHRAYHHGWNNGYRWGRHDGYRQGYDDGWRDARYATWVPRNQVTADNVASHRVGHEIATRSVARSRVTPLPAAPSKIEVERMVGRSVPEARITERVARIDGRDTRVVRPEGLKTTVERHGGETVRTALAPTARSRVSERSVSETRPVDRSVSRSRPSSATDSRSSAVDRQRETRASSPFADTPKRSSTGVRGSTPSSTSSRATVSDDRRQPVSRVSSRPSTRSVQRPERGPAAFPASSSRATGSVSVPAPSAGATATTRGAPSKPQGSAEASSRRGRSGEKARKRAPNGGSSSEKASEKPKRSRRTRG